MEYLQWKIDGEFICDLARTWFWDEDRPYAKCEELLLDCLVTDELTLEERKQIVVEILEGRVKLVGINTLDLVEDGKNIRPLSQKIDELRKKDILNKIEEDIENHALSYIDKYAANADLNDFYNYAERTGVLETPYYVTQWLYSSYNFWTGRYHLLKDIDRSGLAKGTYLMDKYFVYELFGRPLSEVDEDEKYRTLYEYWKEKNDKSTDILYRQNLYEANIKKEEDSSFTEKPKDEEELCYTGNPDHFLSEYGLIDRLGNYYSCGFGGHSTKVVAIMKKHPEWFDKTKQEMEEYIFTAKECDLIYDKGWIVVHNPSSMCNPFFDFKESMVATKKQIITAFDYMAHFERNNMGGIENLLKSEN